MLKTILKLSLVSVLVIVSQACTPGAATPGLSPALIQTLPAATPTLQPGIPITGGESPTPTPMSTQALSPTATPIVVQVSVSQATNCRLGPSPAYERVGGLTIGQFAQVVGRSVDGGYWIIQNPDRPGQICWLWGQFAAVNGNITVLPVYTPPPLPTVPPTSIASSTPAVSATPLPAAGFLASYNGIESCTGTGWWLDIELKNSGGVLFQSISMNVTDTVTSTTLSLSVDNFTNKNGCKATDTRANLPAGGIVTVSSPVFKDSPAGHAIRADIMLCSDPGQSGTCATQTIRFTP